MLRQPKKLWDQYVGKATAELLRGCGWWPVQEDFVPLEPPWQPFDRKTVDAWECAINKGLPQNSWVNNAGFDAGR